MTHIHQASLIGKLVSKKIYPFHIIQPIIKVGWRFVSDLKIEEAGANRFLFTFPTSEEKDCVLSQGPWNFKGSYMVLKEWEPKKTNDEVDLSFVVYWIQIHGLPLEIFDEDNARLIGNKLGEILEMDNIGEHISFLRLKIRFLATQPLQPGFPYYHEDGASVWIGFKYERLFSFCFHCGLIDHTIGSCFQHPPHSQNYALNDKMRGFPPVAQVVEEKTEHSE